MSRRTRICWRQLSGSLVKLWLYDTTAAPTVLVWPTMRSFQGTDWQVVPAGNSLYGGNAGIALFLGLAGHAVNDQRMVSLARR